MALEAVTVALLTPIIIASAGDYAFAQFAVLANNTDVTVQGTPVDLDEHGYGLGIAVLPTEEGLHNYTVSVEQGMLTQEIPVTVIGTRPPVFAWWLFSLPLLALLFSVRVYWRTSAGSS